MTQNLLPPNFTGRANNTIQDDVKLINSNRVYSFKNPKWQQLTINESDEIGTDVTMPRINKEKLFNADSEDVYNIEKEVEYYRVNKAKNDYDLEELKRQKEMLLRELNDNEDEEIEAALADLQIRINQKEYDKKEAEQRLYGIEEENRRLEMELNQPDPTPPPRPLPPAPVRTYATPPPPPLPPVKQRVVTKNILPPVLNIHDSPQRNEIIQPLPQQTTVRRYAPVQSNYVSTKPTYIPPQPSRTTYRVNGREYNDANLPPEYEHLRVRR